MSSTSTSPSIRTDEEWIKTAIDERSVKFIIPEELSIGDRLGSGSFGTVYRAEWDVGIKITVAAKFLKCLDEYKSDQDSYKEFVRELKFLREASCYENILKFYGISKDARTNQYMLILEYCNGGSLRSYLERNFKTMTGAQKLKFAKEVISGLICLHRDRILHRDLNSVNILVHNDTIKIGDLGLSKRVDDIHSNTSEIRGHVAYVDPQCLKNEFYKRDEKSDVYGLGVILWEISSGRPPFQGQGRYTIARRIEQGEREKSLRGTPTAYIDLYTRCWNESPDKRPSAKEAYGLIQQIVWPTTNNMIETEENDIVNEIQTSITNSLQINDSISVIEDSTTSTHRVTSSININQATISDNIAREQHDIQILEDSETSGNHIASSSANRDKKSDVSNAIYDDVMEVMFKSLEYRELIQTCQDISSNLAKNNQNNNEFFNFLNTKTEEKSIFSLFKRPKVKYPNYTSLLGLLYYGGIGTGKNDKSAFLTFTFGAENGDSISQCLCGHCYYKGIGVEKDPVEAVYWYTKSAENGNTRGQNSLGYCYDYGIGVEKDQVKAVYWYTKSAEGGNARGQNNLGYCYDYGICVEKDQVKAVYWYTKSAEGGNAHGQYNLGNCYYEGTGGVEKDPVKAVYWYAKSADGGNEMGQYMLAKCYENGVGITKDVTKARSWYLKSAENGCKDAQKELEKLAC